MAPNAVCYFRFQDRKRRIRRTTLIRPAHDWPNLQSSGIQGGLSMEFLSTDVHGLKHFTWIYSGVYEVLFVELRLLEI